MASLIFFLLSAWTTEVVTTATDLEYPTFVIDSQGNPYILISRLRTASPPILHYLFLFSKSNGNWIADTFELNNYDLGKKDLTIDKSSRIWCIYPINDFVVDTFRYLIVAHKESLGWVKDTVVRDSLGMLDTTLGYWYSITTDSATDPHIALDLGVNGVPYGFYAHLDDSIWQKEMVDTIPTNAYCSAIDLDSQDQPHISYFGNGGFDLWYAKKVDSVWFCEEVDPTNFASWWTTSIRINPVTDLPGIAYRDPNTYQMKYAWYDGVIWHIDTIAVWGIIGTQKALDIDSLNRPWIIYKDLDFPSNVVAYKDTAGVWHKYPLPPLNPPLTLSSPGALRIGRDGTIHVTKIATNADYTIREVHYIYGTPEGIEESEKLKVESKKLKLKVLSNIIKHNAQLQFTIPAKQHISLKLYDVVGREVMMITDGIVDAGIHSYSLNTSHLSSGIYFLILEGEKETKTKKILIVR